MSAKSSIGVDDASAVLESRELLLGECRVRPMDGTVWHGEEAVHLSPQPMRLLAYLAAHHDRVVTKEEIFQQVWDGACVEDSALPRSICEIRRALGDQAQEPRYIRTIPKKGYRLIAPLSTQAPEPTRAEPPSRQRGSRQRGSGLRHRWSRIHGTAAVLFLALAAAATFGMVMRTSTSHRDPGAAAAPDGAEQRLRPAVAVLSPRSPASDAEDWAATAVPALLATRLAQAESVRVVRPEALDQVGLDRRMPAAGGPRRDLLAALRAATGADYVIGGTLESFGDREHPSIRVTLEIYEARSAETLGTFSVTEPAENVSGLVDTATREVLRHLDLREVVAADRLAPRAETVRLYAEALALLDAFAVEDAVPVLRRCIAADPDFLPPRAKLVKAYLELGRTGLAAEEARRALERTEHSPRQLRLTFEAVAAEASQDAAKALSIWQSLWTFFPDEVDYGLGVARNLTVLSRGREALETVQQLRLLPAPLADDPRIDLAAAAAAELAGDYRTQLESARRAERRAFASTLLRARASLEASTALRLSQSVEAGLQAARRAQDLFEQLGHRSAAAESLLEQAQALAEMGELGAAGERARQALEVFRSLGNRGGVAGSLRILGNVSWYGGELAEARSYFERALAEYADLGNRLQAARTRFNVGLAHWSGGDEAAALEIFRRALAESEELGDLVNQAQALQGIGTLQLQSADLAAAVKTLESSLAIRQRIGDRLRAATAHNDVGTAYLLLGDVAAAEDNYAAAYRTNREMDLPADSAYPLTGLAEIALLRGDLSAAADDVGRAMAIHERSGNSAWVEECQLLQARILLEKRQLSEALTLAKEIAAHPEGDPLSVARAHLLAAEAYLLEGRLPQARSKLERLPKGGSGVDYEIFEIQRQILEARHLASTGRWQDANRSLASAAEAAASKSFGILELEARITLCDLEVRRGSKTSGTPVAGCLADLQSRLESSGLHLFDRRLDEIRAVQSDAPGSPN